MTRANGMKKERSMAAVFLLFAFSFGSYEMGFPLGRLAFLDVYKRQNKDTDNSRNGHSSKRLRTSFGDVEVSVPRDRKGEFEPQVLKKNQTSIIQDIEEKILSMYAKGMTTGCLLYTSRCV